MPTPTTRLRAQLQDPGSNLNVWGQLLNDTAISLLDEAIAGVEKISLTGSTGLLTLTSANYATDQARNAALVFTGSPTVDVTVTIPSVEKVYLVSNTTGRNVTLTAGGAGVTLAANDRAPIWCDGTDCGFGAVTKQTVNGLIANAQLAPGDLPDQAANAGRFLKTDGTAPLWADVIIPDVGGGADATITTSVTLAVNASVVQSVDMSSNAQSVKLPDATTLAKGGRKFVILGVGNRTFGVRDNGGTLLTVVPAGAAAELHLRDNATAAGSWGVTGRGLEPALTLVDHTAPTTVTGAVETAVRLTDTLSLHFGTQTNGFLALAVDSTTGAAAAGTWTAVETLTTSVLLHAFRISDTQAIVFWTQAANHKAAVLTVNPTTLAITVGTAASTASVFLASVTFSGRPLIAQLTPTSYVALGSNGFNALAISVSGSTATLGAATPTGSISPAQAALACYRISDTTALALYIDDSGTAGSAFSIRAVVLTVSGTTVTVGTSAGINDVVASAVLPTCQLSATKYVVGYTPVAPAWPTAVSVTVSGTTVAFGSPLTVESTALAAGSNTYTYNNADRFKPNLSRISDTAALYTYSHTSVPSRHVVLTESGGTLTAGGILYSLWTQESGGNFPQTPAGFLAFSTNADEQAVFSVTINGTSLDVTGTFADMGLAPASGNQNRFGLSGGVFGVIQGNGAGLVRNSVYHLFRFAANAPPRYLGTLRRNNVGQPSNTVPVEIAANKVAIITGTGMTQPTASTDNVRLQIIEFAQ